MQNSSGDSASPWYMPHLMLTWAIGFELASRVVFHISIEFWMKALRFLLILYSSRHSSIHVCGIESYIYIYIHILFVSLSLCYYHYIIVIITVIIIIIAIIIIIVLFLLYEYYIIIVAFAFVII